MENFPKNKEASIKKSSLLKSLLVSAIISVPVVINPQEKNPQDIKNKHGKNIVEEKDDSFKMPEFTSFNVTDRFFAEDKKGDTYINPWSIITPLQVEIGTETEHYNKSLIRIPYKYSRNFNTAEAESEDSKKEAVKYIEESIKKELVEKLVFWDPTNSAEDVYRLHHKGETPNLSKVKINNIRIIGLSSPEGPEEKGKRSLAIGNVDKENISLSEKRAGNMDPEVREALKMLGIEIDVISEIKAEEVQFSEAELATLDSLAKSSGIDDAVDELESAFILIKEYNNGKIKDKSMISKLDEIVGSKRMVEIEITYDENKKEKHVVPIPLTLLLLIPGMRWMRREKIRERFKETLTEDPKLLEEKKKDKSMDWNNADFEKIYNLAKNSVEKMQDLENISNRLLIDEFNPYFGTREDDVDYFHYMMIAVHNAGGNKENVERQIAFGLLGKWEENDTAVRNLGREERRKELHYWQEPQKILWAMEAAKHLMHYAEIYGRYHNDITRIMPFPERMVYEEISREIRELRKKNYSIPERKIIRTTTIPFGDQAPFGRPPFLKREKE